MHRFVCSYLYGLLMDVIIKCNYVIITVNIYIFYLYANSCQNTDYPSTPTYPQQTYPPHQACTIQQYPPQLAGNVQSQQPSYPLQEAGYSPAAPTVPITYPVGGYKGMV